MLPALLASSTQRQLASEARFTESVRDNQGLLLLSLFVIIAGVVLAGVIGFFIYRSITQPISQIADTVAQVAQGDEDVVSQHGEFGRGVGRNAGVAHIAR